MTDTNSILEHFRSWPTTEIGDRFSLNSAVWLTAEPGRIKWVLAVVGRKRSSEFVKLRHR